MGSKTAIIIILLALTAAVSALFIIDRGYQSVIVDIPKFDAANKNGTPPQSSPSRGGNESPATNYSLPTTILLPVPFTPQAPTANWDKLHNEACEEASAIMAAYYYSPPKIGGDIGVVLDPSTVESEIQKLTDWQQQTFGYYLSINSQETARMIKAVYGLNAEVMEDFSARDIKNALADGKLVLLPANGRMLGNPYYKRPGPIYHMLVIKGYDSKGNFITNDPGTKRGLNYPYTFDVLSNANGDWNHDSKNVDLTKKMIIVVWQ